MRRVAIVGEGIVSFNQIIDLIALKDATLEVHTLANHQALMALMQEQFISIVIVQAGCDVKLQQICAVSSNSAILLIYQSQYFSLVQLQEALDYGVRHAIMFKSMDVFAEAFLSKFEQIINDWLLHRLEHISNLVLENHSNNVLVLRTFKQDKPNVIFANKSYLKFIGTTFSEFKQKEINIVEEYGLDDLSFLHGSENKVAHKKSFLKKSSTGKKHWFDVVVFSLIDDETKDLKYQIVFEHDVSNYLLKQAENNDGALSFGLSFLRAWSYRLGSDMTNALSALQEHYDDDDSIEFEDTIVNTKKILSGFVKLSKLYTNHIKVEKEYFDIRGFILSLVSENSKHNFKLEANIDYKVPFYINNDKKLLTDLLKALLQIAQKNGIEKLTIGITSDGLESTTKQLSISIIANAKNDIKRIKQSFSWFLKSTPDYATEPIEIGIARCILSLIEGGIVFNAGSAESSLTIHLAYQLSAVNKTINEESENLELKGKKILIVDDVEQNLLVLKKLLNKWDAQVTEANGGRQAVELAKANKYDLIIMDIQMPIMNGYTASQIIKTNYAEQNHIISIIGLSAYVNDSDLSIENKGLLDGYLTKPIDTESLKKILVEQIEQQAIPLIDKGLVDSYRIIDADKIRKFSGGDHEFMAQVITIFLKRTPEYIQELNNAVKAKDWPMIKQMAHKVKPTFTYVGMESFTNRVGSIEMLANEKDISKIKEIMEEVWQDCQIAFSEFEHLLTNLK